MKKIFLIALLAALLLCSGCMATVDQMYRLPKRSEEVANLQSAMDSAMSGLSYSAPLSGENQQTVQTADLDAQYRSGFAFGSQIGFTFRSDLIHLFDPETENNLI